ncbi:MAG: tetratricopeptide repeat protein [Candidatus Promineifilaceae bacterium]
MDKYIAINEAKVLRRDDRLEESQDLLLSLLEEFPHDPQVLFEVGGSYDVMGLEPDAIPYYERAIQQGLEGTDLQECLVCLGSSYRVVGDSKEAVDILEDAVEQFPENNSSKVFLALAYYSNNQEEDAVRTLLELLLTTTKDENILAYADPLDYYKDNLDEIWED